MRSWEVAVRGFILVCCVGIGACDYSASTKVLADTAVTDTATPLVTDTADTDSGDADGDGYTVEQGDCDDADAGVYPGAPDTCDGVDSDCDGVVDQDAAADDAWEPNDTADDDLGSLDDDPDQAIRGFLHNDQDVDRFSFSFTDSALSLFQLDLSLDNIPDGATYAMKLERVDSDEEVATTQGSGSLAIHYDDQVLVDDGGTWRVTIWSEGGAECASPYLLGIKLH